MAGPADDEGDADAVIVVEGTFGDEAVVAVVVAVVGGEDDEGVVLFADGFQVVEQSADGVVHHADHAVVEGDVAGEGFPVVEVGVEAVVEVVESGDVELTLEAAVVVLTLADESADVDAAEEETPAVEDGVRSALPGDAVVPAPAPEDEPAVFDATAADELLVEEDWM